MQKFLMHVGQIYNLCWVFGFFFISTRKGNRVIRKKTSVEWRYRCIVYCLKAFLKLCITLLRSAAVDLVCCWQTRNCDAPNHTWAIFTVASWCAMGLEKWGERYCTAEIGAKERKFWESLWLLFLGICTVHSPILATAKKINPK